MKQYKFYICDVFTDKLFGGNQLAVLPDARGLSTEKMQQIAREFNFSESTFVFPAEAGNTRKVRIFTPANEVPFAGHPNIGTASVMASIGEFGEITESSEIVFEEKAGLVPIKLMKTEEKRLWCELKAPQQISLGKTVQKGFLASAISIPDEEIEVCRHLPQEATVGLPFLITELKSREALKQARIKPDVLDEIAAQGITPDIFVYVRSKDEFDIRSRMFAPFDGIMEDPATGSANCALAGLLAKCEAAQSGHFEWKVAQGVEMGRPSVLNIRAKKSDGEILATWVGGSSVIVCEGHINVE